MAAHDHVCNSPEAVAVAVRVEPGRFKTQFEVYALQHMLRVLDAVAPLVVDSEPRKPFRAALARNRRQPGAAVLRFVPRIGLDAEI